jgi:hypothetical protein
MNERKDDLMIVREMRKERREAKDERGEREI